jgi:hypothetical protein
MLLRLWYKVVGNTPLYRRKLLSPFAEWQPLHFSETRCIVEINRTRWTRRLNHMADESHLSIPAQQGVEEGQAVLAEAVGAYTQALGERLIGDVAGRLVDRDYAGKAVLHVG